MKQVNGVWIDTSLPKEEQERILREEEEKKSSKPPSSASFNPRESCSLATLRFESDVKHRLALVLLQRRAPPCQQYLRLASTCSRARTPRRATTWTPSQRPRASLRPCRCCRRYPSRSRCQPTSSSRPWVSVRSQLWIRKTHFTLICCSCCRPHPGAASAAGRTCAHASGGSRADFVRTHQRAEHVRTNQHAEHVRTNQHAEHVRTHQRAEHVRTNQHAEHVRTHQRAEHVRTHQRAEHVRTNQHAEHVRTNQRASRAAADVRTDTSDLRTGHDHGELNLPAFIFPLYPICLISVDSSSFTRTCMFPLGGVYGGIWLEYVVYRAHVTRHTILSKFSITCRLSRWLAET